MLQFFILHVEKVHICVEVPSTVPIGELPRLADRELKQCLFFHFGSQFLHSLNVFAVSLLHVLRYCVRTCRPRSRLAEDMLI